MVVQSAAPPSEVLERFLAVAHRVVWCTMATVDRRGRPRSRVVHPVWERSGDTLVGWVTSRPTPLRVAHLAATPFVSCSYWDPRHDIAVAECAAAWVDDVDERLRVWEVSRSFPPPLGHDPAAIWPEGPGSPDAGVLRLDPWRLRAAYVTDLTDGGQALAWRADTPGTRAKAGPRTRETRTT